MPLIYGDPEMTVAAGGGATAATLAPRDDNPEGPVTSGVGPGAGVAAISATTTTAPKLSATERANLTASDIGVTATSIRIGVVLLDLGPVEPLGLGLQNFEPETQQKMFQAFIDDLNARGGINGRVVEPVYVINDPLASSNAGNARAQCLKLTQDLKVFAVTGYVTDAGACIVGERRTPLVNYVGDLAEVYAQSANYFIDPAPSFERLAAQWAGALHDLGHLKGKKIGIVGGEAPREGKPIDVLEATIKQLGYEITHRTRFSTDAGTAQSQGPLEVQRMKSKGVDLVLFPTNFATAIGWAQAAEGQGWRPRYAVSDIGALSSAGLVRNMPASFDGAIAVTNNYGGRSEAGALAEERPQEVACRTLYNGKTDGKDFAWGEESPLLQACNLTQIIERAAGAAGPKLTREAFVAAVQSLGSYSMPGYIAGSFGPKKTDFSDVVRPMRWVTACKCYVNTGAALRSRY